jgi:hypothetical protein
MKPREKRIIFVVDDGGLAFDRPDGHGYRIGLECYERVLNLAIRHDITIPIAVTAGFIDIHNLAGLELKNPDAHELIEFLKLHQKRIPVWNHGLTHTYDGSLTEFQLYAHSMKVPENIQRQHLELSQNIFESVGLIRPTVFVPPGHAWEQGVTDRLAKEFGIKHIAIREFEKAPLLQWLTSQRRPYLWRWEPSQYLNTIYRLGLGIPYNRRRLTSFSCWKAMKYIEPGNMFFHYLIHRTKQDIEKPHHFFAHIHNFIYPSADGCWDRLIERILKVQMHTPTTI